MYRVIRVYHRRRSLKQMILITLFLIGLIAALGWAGHIQLQEREDAESIKIMEDGK